MSLLFERSLDLGSVKPSQVLTYALTSIPDFQVYTLTQECFHLASGVITTYK